MLDFVKENISRREFLKKLFLFFAAAGLFSLGLNAKARKAWTKIVPLREAMFYKSLKGKEVKCGVCFRECVIQQGKRGFCRNKENKGGKLFNIVHSRPSAIHVDPIEKEPSLHMLPGTYILCFGTAGCNFRCKFCQNWHLSQRSIDQMSYYKVSPEEAVNQAKSKNIPTLSFTYNDPIAFYEYVYDTARVAKKEGKRILWHSNGTLNEEPLKELLKYTDAVTFDLKGFTEEFYKNTSSASLEPALKSLKTIRKEGVWLELVNLVVPTLNDDPKDIKRMCQWIKDELGKDVPIHFSRFHPAYKLTNLYPTPIETLQKAYRIAKETGLEYVTLGNVPGHKYNSTYCPKCGRIVIKRYHFDVLENNLVDGRCKFCGYTIPGIWA